MTSSLLNDLNPQQKKAVEHVKGPMLILAGAGSGKTRTLTYKVVYLLEKMKIPTHNILMVTFTNKAAEEMKTRIKTLLKRKTKKNVTPPFAGTFHSLCARILRIEGHNIKIPSNYVIYDETDQLDVIKTIMNNNNISVKNYNPRAILHIISQAKSELINSLEYSNLARGTFQKVVADMYREYEKVLTKNAALDFDDLIFKCIVLFQKEKRILAKYQELYKYILVDEYQDTNTAQYKLTKLLSMRYKNICVVGDASQSIYRWRGADFRNIENFTKDFPNVVIFNLEQNYRSSQLILDAAFGVISKNTSHPILKLWTNQDKGEKILLYESRTERDEALFIAQTILQSDRNYTDFAVLYRTNAQSRVIEESFLKSGIPYILVGGIRFYERKEVKDVLSYLKLLANPKDEISQKRARKIGKNRLEKFLYFRKEVSTDNTLISYSTLELLDRILETTKYLDLYNANVEEEAYRLENIKELRSVAAEFPDIHDFLENVALVQQEYFPDELKKKDQKKNAVTLMTLHAAKGLEFPYVFIVGLEEGLFPHSRSMADKEELEEERRLCYVGITRAKERLILSYANRRLYFGTRTQNMISRFISDIPEHTIQYQVSLSPGRGFRSDDFLI